MIFRDGTHLKGQAMATLDRWRAFCGTPHVLSFRELELLARDHEPSIVVGAGEVRMVSQDAFEYTLEGSPSDPVWTLDATRRHYDNAYDALTRFRLVGVDTEGLSWAGGYTVPIFAPYRDTWRFRGEVESLSTTDTGPTVHGGTSAEVVVLAAPESRLAFALN